MCKSLRYSGLIDGMNEAALDKGFDREGFQKNLMLVLDVIDRNKLAEKAQQYRKAANLPYTSINYVDIQQHPIGLFNHKYFEYLSRGAWLKQGDSIVIDGVQCKARQQFVSVFGNELMEKGVSVLFTDMKAMLLDLLVADCKSQLQSALKPLEKIDVLVLDDFELNTLSTKEAYILASLVQTRSEKGGFILLTNTPLEGEIAALDDVGLVGQMLIKYVVPFNHQMNFVAASKGVADA
jgi:hypothetical protein